MTEVIAVGLPLSLCFFYSVQYFLLRWFIFLALTGVFFFFLFSFFQFFLNPLAFALLNPVTWVALCKLPTSNPITLHHQCFQPTALKVKGSRRCHPWTLLPQTWSFYSSPWEERREAEGNTVGERGGGGKQKKQVLIRFSQHVSLKKVCSGLKPKGIKLGTFQLALLAISSPPRWDPTLPLFQGSLLEQMRLSLAAQAKNLKVTLATSLSFTPITNQPITKTCRFYFLVSLDSSPEPSTTLPCLAPEQFLGVSRPRSFHSQHDVAMISLKGKSA